ncbi:GNAT family N-acetyltransferase [Paenibacillus sp. NPDC057967]|uniref:GNAT family N-acetyltransferase n=1 Tax=Paenibacillus sp. NPDC057967 TaxID=3346293 RepID=UPI0036DACD2C
MEFTINEQNSAESKALVRNGLIAFNKDYFPAELSKRYREVNLILIDGDGRTCGGLIGEICWNWLEIHILYIEEYARRHGCGRKLMQEAERLARMGQCDFIKLDTLSFQALDFYKKLGFEVYGQIDNAGGYTHYYMKKDLEAKEGAK